MKTRDDVIAEMVRWSEDFIEQSHPIFGGLPMCPFAKAARLKQSIRFEVQGFAAADPFELDGRVMTLIGEFLGDPRLETLFVIHPEPARIGARALEAWVVRLNARLATCAATAGLQVFEAHPKSEFSIGGVYTRRSPYPSFQVLRRSLLKDASDSLLGSSYYDHFTPEMLRAVGMPRDTLSTSPETPVSATRKSRRTAATSPGRRQVQGLVSRRSTRRAGLKGRQGPRA
jgi:hypothetical protein